ncbi:MAG: response regulator [bacterium]|nr:response regulator [bacterium]
MCDKKTILILDDTKPIRILLLKKFEKTYNCLLSDNPKNAIDLVDEFGDTISLIISDYEMPGMNGYEFLKIVHSRWEEIPIIMLSATLNEERIKDLVQLGVRKFIAKPVNLQRLISEMNKILE